MFAIRRATKDDTQCLMNVVILWPNGSRLLLQEEDGTSSINENRFVDSNWLVLVAVDEATSSIVGYLAGCDWDSYMATPSQTANMNSLASERIAKIEEVLVLPEHQKKGIGTLLVRKFEDWACIVGCKKVQLGGGPAPDFYRALGYNRVGPFFAFVKKI